MKYSVLFCLVILASFASQAAEKTVTLAVPGMNCVTCPITIKKALEKVPGVISAEVSYTTKLARVSFDDEQASVHALTQATTNAGYPSSPSEDRVRD